MKPNTDTVPTGVKTSCDIVLLGVGVTVKMPCFVVVPPKVARRLATKRSKSSKVPFDVVADFTPVAMLGVSSALVCVPPSLPVANLAELVDYARARPGKLNYLNPGNGTGAHLIPEQLKIR